MRTKMSELSGRTEGENTSMRGVVSLDTAVFDIDYSFNLRHHEDDIQAIFDLFFNNTLVINSSI